MFVGLGTAVDVNLALGRRVQLLQNHQKVVALATRIMVDKLALVDVGLLADCLAAELSLSQCLALRVGIGQAWLAAVQYLIGSSCVDQLDLVAVVVAGVRRQHLQQPLDLADIGNVPQGTFLF